MSQFFDYTGVVEEVLPVQTFSSGFTKRDVIVGNDVDSPSKYPNPVKFTFKKDNCSLLDGIQKGQRVQVHFVVDGRRWDGPKGTQYFVERGALPSCAAVVFITGLSTALWVAVVCVIEWLAAGI